MFAAVLEGATIGILGTAIHLVSTSQPSISPSWGVLGAWLEHARMTLGSPALFLILMLAAVFAQVLRSALQFSAQLASAALQTRVHLVTYNRVFSHLMRLDFARASQYRLGDLTNALGRADHLYQLFDYLNLIVRDALMLLSYVVVLLWLSWPMTIVALVVYGVVWRMLRKIIATVRRHAHRFSDATLAQERRAVEFLQAVRLLHTFGRQEEAIRVVDRLTRDGVASRWRIAIWSGLIEPIIEIISVLGLALFLIGGYVAFGSQGAGRLPYLVTLLLAMYRMTPRVGAIHRSVAAIAVHAPHVARIAEILQGEPGQDAHEKPGICFPGIRQAVELQHVTLQYLPEEPPAVTDLSLTLNRGSFTALVGLSGAGKSTVADLLLQLFQPTAGRLLVDGVELGRFTSASWRARVGVVSQEPFLFHASVRENIAFGKPDATQAEIMAAAKQAYADEFIMQLGDGYDTVIGDRGYRLSGGQRQRIALARALIRQPELLVLDEATSALDTESERFIQKAMEGQRGQRTLLAIAHRLSTIAGADQILVLGAGRLVEQGTHEALLAREGTYARLWQLQSERHHALMSDTAVEPLASART